MIVSQELLVDRFPIPRYIICDQGGSQARFQEQRRLQISREFFVAAREAVDGGT